MYELTALKPAFNAFNIDGLIHKIRRGGVAALPPSYSQDWSALVLRCNAACAWYCLLTFWGQSLKTEQVVKVCLIA